MEITTESTTTVATTLWSKDTSQPNWSLFYAIEIFTIIFMSILGIATTIINGFTIYVIYKDPLQCFRTPLTTFITGIIISDFFTGLCVEPAIAALYAISYFHHSVDYSSYQRFLRTTQILSLVTLNTSFFIFLALAISGLLALGWPTVYERRVTNFTAKVCIGFIWFYSAFFALLPEMTSMSLKVYYTIDLVLHTTVVTICLMVIYIVTYIVFKKKISRFIDNTEQDRNQPPAPQRSPPRVEKDFLKGTFLLTFLLILTVWPFTIALYIWFFNPSKSYAEIVDKYIAVVICENILLSKFLWDPAILILRIPTYRKSMVMLFNGFVSNNAAGVVVYNRHADEELQGGEPQETIVEEGNNNEIRT